MNGADVTALLAGGAGLGMLAVAVVVVQDAMNVRRRRGQAERYAVLADEMARRRDARDRHNVMRGVKVMRTPSVINTDDRCISVGGGKMHDAKIGEELRVTATGKIVRAARRLNAACDVVKPVATSWPTPPRFYVKATGCYPGGWCIRERAHKWNAVDRALPQSYTRRSSALRAARRLNAKAN